MLVVYLQTFVEPCSLFPHAFGFHAELLKSGYVFTCLLIFLAMLRKHIWHPVEPVFFKWTNFYRASKHSCLQKTGPWKGWSPFRWVCDCLLWTIFDLPQISKRQFRYIMWTWMLEVWDKSKPSLTVLSKRDKRVSQPAAKKAFNPA